MPVIYAPPELDLNYYRNAHPELSQFHDSVLIEHHKRFAVQNGLTSSPCDLREQLKVGLQENINVEHLKTLEIGCGGFPFLAGENVKYFEIMSVDNLKRHYIEVGRNIDYFPEKFDFVSPNGDLGVVDEKFDIVFSSHVIEHVTDIIEHFRNVSRILNTGGVYVLIVPDKRYCFDYYNPESTLTEVIDAFANERKTPRLADVINSVYMRTHNNAMLHWFGEHGERYGYRKEPLEPGAIMEILGEKFFDDGKGLHREELFRLIEKYAEALATGKYISVHNWRFTPDSFGYIVKLLNELNFIDLSLYRLYHTVWGRLEFTAMLEKI